MRTYNIIFSILLGMVIIGMFTVQLNKCTCPHHEDPSTEIILNTLQTQIGVAQHQINTMTFKVDSLKEVLVLSESKVDSLQLAKNQIKIIYKDKIKALNEADIQKQYNVLLNYLRLVDLSLQRESWHVSNTDTSLLVGRADLISINTAGILHQQCDSLLILTEAEVIEQGFQINTYISQNELKDSIIFFKDSIITDQWNTLMPLAQQNKKLNKKNNILKWVAGITSSALLITLLIK